MSQAIDRDRALSFGSVAESYDRYRPGYPDNLLDDLVALSPKTTLDVGCGTGKVATALMRRSLSVLGVEADPRMSAIARGHGVEVEECDFETWADAGRRFDLLTCGEAWHWIDPARGIAKAAKVLTDGGTMALFWNDSMDIARPLADEIDAVYRALAPEITEPWGGHPGPRPELQQLTDAPEFTEVEQRRYLWDRTITTDEWTGRAGTVSNHIRLGEHRLAGLLDGLRTVLDSHGGEVPVRYQTTLLISRRSHRTDAPPGR